MDRPPPTQSSMESSGRGFHAIPRTRRWAWTKDVHPMHTTYRGQVDLWAAWTEMSIQCTRPPWVRGNDKVHVGYIKRKVMASSVNEICTICHDDGISKSAVTWCTECEVFFCGDCEKPQSKSRLSKNHKTMSAEAYQKLPTFMQDISSQCRDHKKKFELYCSFHACPCCVQCVTDKQKKCQDMTPLSDILQQVKSSASVQLFAQDLKDVKENLDTAIKYLKSRTSTIDTQKTKAVEEIMYMRKSMIDYLNKLEQEILNDLESKHCKA
ncbi:unnamed protein product [Mytilus coruscus]|uniref:B box-type domain-containing protein n=1 Tax=Mytilus coruscus TaxID=42192 RepID=A0A6J8C603_MYTCO|nr:unnamed protein product [Mytilus coruscus]